MYLYLIAYAYIYNQGMHQQTTIGNLEYTLDHKFGSHKSDLENLHMFVDHETKHHSTIQNIMFISKG